MLRHLLWFRPCQVAILPGFRVKKAKEILFWPFSHVPPSALVSALSGGHPVWQSCQKGKIESFLAIFSHVPQPALVWALSGGHPAWLLCQKGKIECSLAISFILAMFRHLLLSGPCQEIIHLICTLLNTNFICRPPDSTEMEEAGIAPRTVAFLPLAVRPSNHSARSHFISRAWVWFSFLY